MMMEKKLKRRSIKSKDEKGFATIIALMILTLLTIIGISGINISNFELQSATNHNLHKMAFFSAESSRAYLINNTNLYGAGNIDPATPHLYPNNSDPYVPITAGTVAPFNLGNGSAFSGSVQYIGPFTAPRGSGYQANKFKAHTYESVAIGTGPRNTTQQIEVGFYRIGL
jgi:hypothetical protein